MDLTKKLEEKWGVSATIAAAVVENITDDSTEDICMDCGAENILKIKFGMV